MSYLVGRTTFAGDLDTTGSPVPAGWYFSLIRTGTGMTVSSAFEQSPS